MTTAPDGGGLTEAEREALGLAVEADLDAGWSDMDFDGYPLQIEAAVERILAARSTAPDTEAIAAAEQRGREDNSEHSMCYVSGSRALAAREAAAAAEALEAAADAIYTGPGSQFGRGFQGVDVWLRARAAAVREGSDT